MPNAVPTLDDSQSTRFAETVFRVVGSSRDGQELRVRSAKVTIGAAPGCTLRLRARGVQPVHCVVIRGRRATVVRAWSADTRLNGRAFQDACLRPGDRLTLGPIELEYIGSTQRLEAAPTGPAEAPAPAASPKGAPEPRRTKSGQSRPATQQPGAQRRLAHAPHDDAPARPTAMADQHGGQPRSEAPGQSERDRAWEEFHQQRRALEERMAELEKREEVLKRREEELTRHEAQLRADQTEYARQQAELDQKRSDSTPSHAKSPADTAHESRKPPASLGGSAVSPPGRRLPQRSPQPMEPSSAPERQVNLAAMREVANSSSSAAVNTYAKRRIRNAMRSRLSVAAVAGIAGAVLLYFWARWTPAVSVTFYAALVAFILAAFWAVQYGVLFVYWLRIRRALADSARGMSNQPELETRGEPSGDRPGEGGESTADNGDRREHQGEHPA